MRKSARLLGHELRMTAREVNVLLKEHGYLEGEPGAYFLTEKGKQYGQDQDRDSGNPRSLSYYAAWTTTSWDESILPELKAALDDPKAELASAPVDVEEDAADEDDFTWEPTHVSGDDEEAPMPVWLAVAFFVGVGLAGSSRVQRWVTETAQPRAQQSWLKAKRTTA